MSLEPRSSEALCPSCNSSESRVHGLRDGHEILRCESCGLFYFCRPIKHSYDYQEYYPYLDGFDKARFLWELGIRRRKYQKQLAHIRRFVSDARTLVDVGAGPGYFCAVALAQGWDAYAVEPSATARNAGEQQFGVAYAELERIGNESVDLITCHHVLEHIEEINLFLDKLRAKLRTGGLLVLHVPNFQPLSFLLRDRLLRSNKDLACSLYYPVHINGFTSTSLVRVVERRPFQAISVFNASMWSTYYDPFFLKNYFRNEVSTARAAGSVLKHAARCAVDAVGNAFDRGDWLVGYFRAV